MESIQSSLRGLSSFKAHGASCRLCKGNTGLLRIEIHMFRLLQLRLFEVCSEDFATGFACRNSSSLFSPTGRVENWAIQLSPFHVFWLPLYFHIVHFQFSFGCNIGAHLQSRHIQCFHFGPETLK